MERKGMAAVLVALLVPALVLVTSQAWTQQKPVPQQKAPHDAVMDAQTPREVPNTRPEQAKNDHDRWDIYDATKAEPSSTAFAGQPDQGKILGFDFYRDPLDAKKPMMTFQEVYNEDVAAKKKVMDEQRQLLELRYNLNPKLSPDVKMTRGKPIAVGPTARLAVGTTWDILDAMTAPDMRSKNLFPYPPLPHPKQVAGGMVFPKMQTDMFPRLQRFDVDFDIPDAFLPEFPPAIFLQNRPELGDVSRGEVVSINNYYRLFKDLLTPVQLDGLRMLLTPFPQEEFNATDDRKSPQPSLGVTCLDCHVNGHTTAQFHLNPDSRPQERRFRLDTVSLRGLFNQQLHGSKRSLRSVEDFSEFEQRTAYFNGDEIHAAKKGMNVISRVQVSNMAQMQNMFDVPPAPKLDPMGMLIPAKATAAEMAGQRVFFGKGKCGSCHQPPFYMDQQMHDLQLERFTREPGDGPIKTFTLRGIKESPPYLHDGRCFTLEDTVEFFNLVLSLKLSSEEKSNLVAFLRTL
jgi:cytochrome c peroxidase